MDKVVQRSSSKVGCAVRDLACLGTACAVRAVPDLALPYLVRSKYISGQPCKCGSLSGPKRKESKLARAFVWPQIPGATPQNSLCAPWDVVLQEKKGGIVRYRTPEAASEALSGFNARPEAERSIGGVKADLKMVEGKEEQEFYERRALLQATNSSGTEAWVHPRLCVAAAAVSSASYPQIVEACCSNPASSCSSGRSGPWSWEWQGATATTQDEEGEAEEEGEAVEETEGGAEEVDGEVGVAEAAEVAEEGVKKIIGEQALAGWDGTVHGFGGGMAQSFNLWPGFEHAF
eukprot:scaffold65110_cov16-Tisochrysis_lutea.AAC.1